MKDDILVPVVLIHTGRQDYLECGIRQACKTNKVYLIGDSRPFDDSDNFTFLEIGLYNDGIEPLLNDRLQKCYVHLNTTPEGYERFCYCRWIILNSFMEKHNLDTVFYIDSDMLLFADVTSEWKKFDQYDMTLLHRTTGSASFITRRGLNNFLTMLFEIYENKNSYHFQKIKSHFDIRQKHGLSGGVCDMTLLEYFHYHAEFGGGPGRVGEMMQIIDGTTYDHNINVSDQDFAMLDGTKHVKIIDKQPYVYNEKLKQNIRFNGLHFQGQSKPLMRSIYEKCS